MTFQESAGYVGAWKAIAEIAEHLFGEVPGLLDYRAAAE